MMYLSCLALIALLLFTLLFFHPSSISLTSTSSAGETMDQEPMLKKYITNQNTNQRIGVVIATRSAVDGKVRVGWSILHPGHTDVYDNYLAHKIAYGRVDNGSNVPIPQSIKDEVLHMVRRATPFFKCEVEIAGKLIEDLAEYRKQQTALAREAKHRSDLQ